ncbi:AAA family ATPase [Sorangium sp. So ce367]|uniref:AAA family ATPase n=1 Tax=Sorangium sp. So ce367 TaxID=3133305 RepID=UPI003F620E31
MVSRKLPPSECRKIVEPQSFRFSTTEEVAPLSAGIGSQERALAALAFGLDIRQPRFHVVVVGAPGTGRTFCARAVAKRIAASRPTPDDILLLPNPHRPSEPTVLSLPPGEGRPFVEAMEELHEKLVDALRGATEGERFKQARGKIQRRVNAEERRLEEQLKSAARELGLDLVRGEDEVQITSIEDAANAPDGEALLAIAGSIEEFEMRLATVQDEADVELRGVVKQLLSDGVKACFQPVRARFEGRNDISAFLADVETVVSKEFRLLVDEARGEEGGATLPRGVVVPTLLTEHTPDSGAPVVDVPYPTLTALFGRTHAPPDSGFPPEPGFAVAGALHEAAGGFLILPAGALLKNEALYEQLKACLLAGKFIVPEHNPSYFRGTAEELLFPPIPIDVKVVLVTNPQLYQDLHDADPEFSQLFKVQARFETTISLDQALLTYPAFLAGFAHDRGLPPITADGVTALLFHGGRLAESQTKVSAQVGLIAEVATEAGYRAQRRGRKVVDGPEVNEALEAARRRGSHFRDHVHELLSDGTIRIDVTGRRVGQVNAISVLSDGPQTFGRPCRVTAVVYPGREGPVNIAREVEMSGPLHSKGVLVLTGFLAARFAQHRPLSFGASLVFEQTYEPIEGDSASSSELYALLSALSGVPIRQELAVTGSIDQQGSIQPVGGINEKIEAFFDLCAAKGLTGEQGVLIPSANRDALMLRGDVVTSIEAGRFHVFEVSSVEEGIEIITGVPAGVADADGRYPEGTVFHAADQRLERFHQAIADTQKGGTSADPRRMLRER